jgi:phosphatidylserine decarboxylase
MGRFPKLAIREKDSAGVNFLYRTVPGRCLLQLLIRPGISKALGAFLDTGLSRHLVKPFVQSTKLDLSDYPERPYSSFNDFFTRTVREGRRPVDMNPHTLIAPCDGKLTVYPITAEGLFDIKHSVYSVADLLRDEILAKEFEGGTCLIFRLTPDDFHRYSFMDDGHILESRALPGVLHTVRPIAFRRYPVFSENAREFAVLETANFGKVIQMEVGALFVGRIVNHPLSIFARGQEKGKFEFGGSTVILLLQKNTAIVHEELLENTRCGYESIVRLGQKIGQKA